MIHLDYSALNLLPCRRAFQFRVVHNIQMGCKTSPILNIANLGHYVGEHLIQTLPRDTPTNAAHLIILSAVAKLAKQHNLPVAVASQAKVAAAFVSALPHIQNMDPEFTEQKFSLMVKVDDRTVTLSGTIDCAEWRDNFLYLSDWKTIFDGGSYFTKIKEYYMSLQVPLYMWALRRLTPSLEPRYQDAITLNRFCGQYLGLALNAPTPFCVPSDPIMANESLYTEVETILNNSIRTALNIFDNDTKPYPAEGRLYGSCKYCPYTRICDSMPSRQIEGWIKANSRRDSEPYNPLAHRA